MMDSLGEILKKKEIGKSTSGASTDTWSKGKSGKDSPPGLTCPICKGAGFIHPLSTSGQPDFSRVVPCQCRRQGLKKEKLSQLQQFSNLGALSRMNFDNLIPTGKYEY